MIDIFCIGWPGVIGDSIGPAIGTELQRLSFYDDVKIIGTMDNPVFVDNYTARLQELRPGAFVIAIDAAMSTNRKIGSWDLYNGPIKPGSGVGRNLLPVGDFNIKACTANNIKQLLACDKEVIEKLLHEITTKLADLITIIKKVYI